jgi:hypothetical protein
MVMIDRSIALEDGAGGHPIGRDPREMTHEELKALGHEPQPVLEVIRAKCLDCAGGEAGAVRRCNQIECPLWPFRMGKNPWRAPRSEAQVAVTRSMGRKRLAAEPA